MLACHCRRRLYGGRCAAETRRGSRLRDAIDFNEALPRHIVRVLGSLLQVEYRCKTDIGAFEQRAPVITGLGSEENLELASEARPVLFIVLFCKLRVIYLAELEKQRVELGFNLAYANKLAVRTGVASVVMCTAV